MAMSIGSTAPVLLASIIAIGVSLVSPVAGLTILAFMGPFPRPEVVPAPGLYVALIGSTLLGVVLRLPIDRPRQMNAVSPPVLAIGAYLLYVTTQYVGGTLLGMSAGRQQEVASLFASLVTVVLAFFVATAVLRGRSPYAVVIALLVSALVTATTAIAQSLALEGLFGALVGPPTPDGRMTGVFADPNYFGAYLAAATTLAVACAVAVSSRWGKILSALVAVVVFAALLLTLSRGAIVALIAGLVILAFVRGRGKGILAVLVGGIGFAVLYPLFAASRFGSGSELASSGIAESSDRIGPWMAGLEQFQAAPLFGIGFGRMIEESSFGGWAHNWYITVLGEGGLIGLALWALFIIAVVLGLRERSQHARSVGYPVIAAWMTASLFLEVPMLYQPTALVVIILAASLAADWSRGDDRLRSTTAPQRPSQRSFDSPGTIPELRSQPRHP